MSVAPTVMLRSREPGLGYPHRLGCHCYSHHCRRNGRYDSRSDHILTAESTELFAGPTKTKVCNGWAPMVTRDPNRYPQSMVDQSAESLQPNTRTA